VTVDLVKELRDGLEGVTPGPWQANEGIEYPRGQQYYYITDGCSNLADDVDMADAAHIARCSPENIAALLDHIAAIRAENERLRTALIDTGRNLGAGLSDEVSNDFLMLLPEEARLVKAKADALPSSTETDR
jgi:hypothetical protein